MVKDQSLRHLTLGAVVASLVMVSTMFLKIPTATGYIHLGDGVIFAASFALGPALGGASAALGSGLADLFSGYAFWAPWTFVIKGVAGVIVGLAGARTARTGKRSATFLGMALSAVWIVAGYALGTIKIYGAAAALKESLGNVLQTGSGILIGVYLGPILKEIVGKN